nr:immunoglobulin heavy chain junction region [Mus musculus]MBK4184294.1 immunoglobulin heavy chain junction region [Mus musculus]
CTELYYFDYW